MLFGKSFVFMIFVLILQGTKWTKKKKDKKEEKKEKEKENRRQIFQLALLIDGKSINDRIHSGIKIIFQINKYSKKIDTRQQ